MWELLRVNGDAAILEPDVPWRTAPFVLSWADRSQLPRRPVRAVRLSLNNAPAPPWIESPSPGVTLDYSHAISELLVDICRHVPEFQHIEPARVLVAGLQARNARGHGLQARVTPLRFHGGHLIRAAHGRLFQVQRYVVAGVEMLYVMTFCLPRFLDQDFDDKMVTLFHELFHIGPRFDGDLRRHRGRCSLHTASKKGYDARMAELARSYLAGGAHPQWFDFLRLNFAQLRARHGRVVCVRVPRPKILPVPIAEG